MTVLPPFQIEKRKRIGKKTKELTIDELIKKLKDTDVESASQKKLLNKLKSEIHKKIAFSFAPLIFAIVGVPLALITRRGDILISFALSLIVITVYYVLFAVSSTIAVNGIIPPEIVLWLPNVILFGIGVWLMSKFVST